MSDRTVQAVYQAHIDQNLPITPLNTDWMQPGQRLLGLLPPSSYWALLQAGGQRALLALYTLSPNPNDYFPASPSLLDDQRVQERARELAAAVAGENVEGPWWVLLSKTCQPGLKPPCRIGAATDLRGLPNDQQLARVARSWISPKKSAKELDGLRQQLDERLRQLSEVLAPHMDVGTRQIQSFYEDIWWVASVELGRDLAYRLTGQRGSVTTPSLSSKPEDLRKMMEVDAISVEIGTGLIALVSDEGPLIQRMTSIRRNLALELGLVIPGVRIRDNVQLKPLEYLLKIHDLPVGSATLSEGHYLCIGPDRLLDDLEGEPTSDPTYQMRGKWICPSLRAEAEAKGGMVFDHVSIIATQLTDAIRRRAADLLTLEQAQLLLKSATYKAALEAVNRRGIDDVELWNLLRELLTEGVSIRDLSAILHSLLVPGGETPLEKARRGLARQITRECQERDGKLHALVVTPELEQQLLGPEGRSLAGRLLNRIRERGRRPVFLTTARARQRLSAQLRLQAPEVQVLAPAEVAPGTEVVDMA